jgi:hypothetical protein
VYAVGPGVASVSTRFPLTGRDAAQQRPLTALDLYHLRTAGGVALSPDGRRVVYVVTARSTRRRTATGATSGSRRRTARPRRGG